MTSLRSGVRMGLMKTIFKKLDLKKLRQKFDYDSFYQFLTTKVKAADGKFYNPGSVISELEINVGIGSEESKPGVIMENNLFSQRKVLDKKFPSISIEDGSLFSFFNKNIECETLFAAQQQRYQEEPFLGLLSPWSYYFLFSFKDKDKKVLTHMNHHPDYGWDMDVTEIFEKNISMSEINKKVLDKIYKEDCICYQFMFFSKSLKVNIKKFVKTFEKHLKPIEDNTLPKTDDLVLEVKRKTLIRTFDMYIYEIDPKIKIPFLSNIESSSVPDFFYKSNKKKNIIELKVFKKGKIEKLLGRKVEIKSTKKYKVKPLFVYRFLKDDWKKIKGKLTGLIFFK